MSKIEEIVTPLSADFLEGFRWIDEYLLSHNAITREFQPAWQAYKYLLDGKMLAYIGIKDSIQRPILTIKLEPAFSEMLRQQYPDIIPGYYMNKTHWSSIYLDGKVPTKVIQNIIDESYELMFSSLPKSKQQSLK